MLHEDLIRQVADGTLSRVRRMYAAIRLGGAVPLDDEVYRQLLDALPQMAADIPSDDAQTAQVITQCFAIMRSQMEATQDVSDETAPILRQLIQHPHPYVAGGAIAHTGELRERGRFALETILQRVASSDDHFPESATLRGIAFLAAYRIDPASVRAAQYSAARQDCLELIARWLQDHYAQATKTALTHKIALTQEYEAIASWDR